VVFVANFIPFAAVQKFGEITDSLKVGTFFETQCSYITKGRKFV